jgi:hypothetical protein
MVRGAVVNLVNQRARLRARVDLRRKAQMPCGLSAGENRFERVEMST